MNCSIERCRFGTLSEMNIGSAAILVLVVSDNYCFLSQLRIFYLLNNSLKLLRAFERRVFWSRLIKIITPC